MGGPTLIPKPRPPIFERGCWPLGLWAASVPALWLRVLAGCGHKEAAGSEPHPAGEFDNGGLRRQAPHRSAAFGRGRYGILSGNVIAFSDDMMLTR